MKTARKRAKPLPEGRARRVLYMLRMKKKTIEKRHLQLVRELVRKLDDRELSTVDGGMGRSTGCFISTCINIC